MVIEPNPRGFLANVQVIIRSGSLSDPIGKQGLAHLTARMLLRGSSGIPYAEFTKQVESLGGSIQARVDHEITLISGTVIAENLNPFLALLEKVLTQPDLLAS